MNDPDLFGHGTAQSDLFANEPIPQQRKPMDYPVEARARLEKVLAEARAAATLPWSDRDVRMWEILFPQMAEWLPREEGAQLLFEFETEMERLKNAA